MGKEREKKDSDTGNEKMDRKRKREETKAWKMKRKKRVQRRWIPIERQGRKEKKN